MIKYAYFSTPTFDVDKNDISRRIKAIKSNLPDNYILLNNSVDDAVPNDIIEIDDIRFWKLVRSLDKMVRSDLVIFSHDWSNSAECRLEMNAAISFHKKIIVSKETKNE